MNDSNTKEVLKLQKMVKNAVEFRKKQRDHEYVNNEAHYEGLHWNLSNVGKDSPFIVKSDINHLKNAVKIRLGSLYANTYYGRLKPLSEDDIKPIENLNVLYKNEWYRLNTDQLIEDAIRNGAIFDNGYLKFSFDPDKIVGGTNTRREGVLTLELVETANVYLDPNANNIDDCDYMVEKIIMTMDRIKREHPDWYSKLKNNNITGGTNKNEDNGSIFEGREYSLSQEDNIVIDVIYEKITEVKEIDIEKPIEVTETTEDGNIEVFDTTETIKEKIRVTRIRFTYMVGKTILEVNDKYPFEDFPIVSFQWEKQPQSPYGIPLLRGLTVPQKVANLIESATNNIAIHYTVPTWLVSDESGLDVDEVAQLINAVGVVWKVDNIDNAIKQLDPPKLDKDIVTMGQTFVEYIKEYAGVNQAYVGNVGTAGSTSSGTTDAIGRATIIDNDPIKQITVFVEKLSRIMIKFMTRYYSGQEFYSREESSEGNYKFSSFKIDENFDDINYDFDVDLGSRNKNDKNRQYNLIKDIYQLQNQYKDPNPVVNVADVIKAAELDNYEEMKNRLDNLTEEALAQKATLIVQLMQISETAMPNGEPLVSPEELQEGIMDILNDDNNLSTVEAIFNNYKQYQTMITDIKNSQYNNTVRQQMGVSNTQNTL